MQLYNIFTDNPYIMDGIELVFSEKEPIELTCPVPDIDKREDDVSLALISKHEDLYNFMFEFVITNEEDLKKINPALLLKRFEVGRCDLYCYLDEDLEYYLSFRRNRSKLIAQSPDNTFHEVPSYVKTVKEIIIYTQYYYEKLLA